MTGGTRFVASVAGKKRPLYDTNGTEAVPPDVALLPKIVIADPVR